MAGPTLWGFAVDDKLRPGGGWCDFADLLRFSDNISVYRGALLTENELMVILVAATLRNDTVKPCCRALKHTERLEAQVEEQKKTRNNINLLRVRDL